MKRLHSSPRQPGCGRSKSGSNFSWIANEPEAGSVIAGSGGCRKIRWSRPGMGKQGGVRVVYFTRLDLGELCMLLIYPKSVRDSIPGHILKEIRKEMEKDDHS